LAQSEQGGGGMIGGYSNHGGVGVHLHVDAVSDAIASMPKDLVSIYFACFVTGHTPSALITLAKKGEFPPIYDFRRGVYKMRLAEFQAWYDDSRVGKGDGALTDIKQFEVDRKNREVGNAS
jgi:hypothetical protein